MILKDIIKKKKRNKEIPQKVPIDKDVRLVQKIILVAILLQENILLPQEEGRHLGLQLNPAAINILFHHLAGLLHHQHSIILLSRRGIILLLLSRVLLFKDVLHHHATKELLPHLIKEQLHHL